MNVKLENSGEAIAKSSEDTKMKTKAELDQKDPMDAEEIIEENTK